MKREAREALKVPAWALLGLLLLLALNVALAFVPLGWIRPLVAPLVSALMALVVLVFCMRLTHGDMTLRLVAASGFLWLALLIGLALTDFLARPPVPPPW